MTGTGFVSSFLHTSNPIGATIKTVATLSTNALTTPANKDKATTAHFTFGTIFNSFSAILIDMLLSINNSTTTMMPESIKIIFQSTAKNTFETGNIPVTTKIHAVTNAVIYR